MAHNLFLSHYAGDREIAEVLSRLLKRISLGQINVWYTSDTSESGGLKPGNIWFAEIFDKIKASKAVIVILTPNSINRPWIYFESGMGQSLEECDVIPICVGINRDSLVPPLNLYQCYQTTDYKSIKEFVSKLLNKFGVTFDEDAYQSVLQEAITDFSKVTFQISNQNKKVEIADLIDDLRDHIDKRFLEVIDSQYETKSVTNNNLLVSNRSALDKPLYSVTFNIKFTNIHKDLYLDVRTDDTFQDVTNNIYFQLRPKLAAYTYLESWIIVENETNTHVVVREIADRVLAKWIFKSNMTYSVVSLKKPYDTKDSSKRLLGKIQNSRH